MYSEIFESLGLSPNEAKIYETLLSTGETSVQTIATKSGIHRRNIYDALERLLQKGLVSPIFMRGENRYQAVHPDKLLEILKEKEKKLESALPALRKKFGTVPQEEAAYIYKGPEGFKSYVRDSMRLKEPTFAVGAKGILFSISPELHREFWKDVKKNNINFYTLYDPLVATKLPQVMRAEGGNKKILPPGYETSGVLDIFSDRVVTFANVEVGKISDDTTIFVMINRALAESYKTWFKFMWDRSLEIK